MERERETKPVDYMVFVQEKLCLSQFTATPPSATSLSRDLQSSQRKASVQSLLLAGNFLYNQKQPSAVEGEVANFQLFRILKKNTIFNEHPVAIIERTQICMCNVFIVFQNLLIHGLVDQNSRLTL